MKLARIFQQTITRRISKLIDIRPTPIILGRWQIDYCPTKLDHKIEFANEDHCGPCGQKIKAQHPKKLK